METLIKARLGKKLFPQLQPASPSALWGQQQEITDAVPLRQSEMGAL